MKTKNVRVVFLILGVLHALMLVGAALICHGCPGELAVPAAIIMAASAVRLFWMCGSGIAQAATASTMLVQQRDNSVVDNALRHRRRIIYKRWLWWSRFGILVMAMQIVGATYLAIVIIKKAMNGHNSSSCYPGHDGHVGEWKQILVVFLVIMAWISAIAQCCAGSNVLAWRSFYATHDGAWKAHYREIFDHGIREVLCCLGRAKYLSALEDDEVHSVAGLLGDLVAYRAAGAGHLEFLAGIALLQRQTTTLPSLENLEQFIEAPEDQIQEAVVLHPFAEAAYTGPLLDVGRNPIIFPCAWLYRQGVLTPWSRSRRPILQGDNWWRGHAAAYLKFVSLPPDALRKGRVHQAKREAAYFAVVVHHLQCVVIAVRGTETPEDLMTDVLCRECMLSEADLDGLLNSNILNDNVKQRVGTTFPHFGHSGIVEAARELCMQLDGNMEDVDRIALDQNCESDNVHGGPQDASSQPTKGFLSSILGPGGECHGYALRFVGHSLGGAIGALAGIMLHKRYSNLHVYTYGVLPCVDAVIADACSSFVTSIIYNDEFSSRLSVTSMLRLRAAALAALAADSSTDSAMISKLARRLLHANKYLWGTNCKEDSLQTSQSASMQTSQSGSMVPRDENRRHKQRHFKYKIKGGIFLCIHATSCIAKMSNHSSTHPMRNPVKFKLHTSFEGNLLNDGKHCDIIVDAAQFEGCLSFENKTPKHASSSDKQTSALAAGAESRDKLSFDECTVLIEDSDTENNGNNQQDASYKDNVYSDELHVHSRELTIENVASGDSISQVADTNLGPDVSEIEPVEMFVPGLVIHIVPEAKQTVWPSWKNLSWLHRKNVSHRAILRDRESFKDIIVSPSMFLDHVPWRCHYAMQKVLDTWKSKDHNGNDRLDACHLV